MQQSHKKNCQKPMLRQTEWTIIENATITKNGALTPTTLFSWKLNLTIREPAINNWFDVQTTQISIFIPLVSAWVLF